MEGFSDRDAAPDGSRVQEGRGTCSDLFDDSDYVILLGRDAARSSNAYYIYTADQADASVSLSLPPLEEDSTSGIASPDLFSPVDSPQDSISAGKPDLFSPIDSPRDSVSAGIFLRQKKRIKL